MSLLVAQRPGAGQPRPYRFPQVVRRTVAGAEVVAAHLPGQPLAVAALLLDAGAGREPAGREGVASVVANALEEGTVRRDAAGVRAGPGGPGRGPVHRGGLGRVPASVSAPADRLPRRGGAARRGGAHPAAGPGRRTRVRDDEVTALRMYWAEPGPRADAALRADLFGAGDRRYGRPLHGDPDSVAAVTVDDVVAFHRSWLTRPGTLLVAGDLDRLDLDALAATAFAGTGAQPVPVTAPIEAPPRTGRRILLVDRPGSVQSVLRLGHAAPHRATRTTCR